MQSFGRHYTPPPSSGLGLVCVVHLLEPVDFHHAHLLLTIDTVESRTFNRMLGIIIPLLRCWFALQRAQAHGEIIDLTDLQIKSLGERSNKGWVTVSNVATSLRCWEDALN